MSNGMWSMIKMMRSGGSTRKKRVFDRIHGLGMSPEHGEINLDVDHYESTQSVLAALASPLFCTVMGYAEEVIVATTRLRLVTRITLTRFHGVQEYCNSIRVGS